MSVELPACKWHASTLTPLWETFCLWRRHKAQLMWILHVQSEDNIVAGVKAAPQPKVVTFTGHAAPSKGP